jgi:hypothetical protein
MKQPKTDEEFMALPVRDLLHIRYEESIGPDGRTVRRPVRSKVSGVFPIEHDTVILCDGYTLGFDEDGFCRRRFRL